MTRANPTRPSHAIILSVSADTAMGLAMFFDRSWMAYGLLGGLEIGAITALIGVLGFVLFHRLARDLSLPAQLSWAFLLAMALGGGKDIWDLLYFNFAPLQSPVLLRVKLAEIHDPDGMGIRVVCALVGATLGVYLGWALPGGGWRAQFAARDKA